MRTKMIQEALVDTAKVGSAVLSVSLAVEFVDGIGKVIAWAIGTAYILFKCIKAWRELNESSDKK